MNLIERGMRVTESRMSVVCASERAWLSVMRTGLSVVCTGVSGSERGMREQ